MNGSSPLPDLKLKPGQVKERDPIQISQDRQMRDPETERLGVAFVVFVVFVVFE